MSLNQYTMMAVKKNKKETKVQDTKCVLYVGVHQFSIVTRNVPDSDFAETPDIRSDLIDGYQIVFI